VKRGSGEVGMLGVGVGGGCRISSIEDSLSSTEGVSGHKTFSQTSSLSYLKHRRTISPT